jgi:hypothetical protein
MQKTDVNTVLAIFFVASAVIMIGGLAIVPTIQSASANHGERHGLGGGIGVHGGGGGEGGSCF